MRAHHLSIMQKGKWSPGDDRREGRPSHPPSFRPLPRPTSQPHTSYPSTSLTFACNLTFHQPASQLSARLPSPSRLPASCRSTPRRANHKIPPGSSRILAVNLDRHSSRLQPSHTPQHLRLEKGHRHQLPRARTRSSNNRHPRRSRAFTSSRGRPRRRSRFRPSRPLGRVASAALAEE